MLLSLFALNPPSKASSFETCLADNRFPKASETRREGEVGGSPVPIHLHSPGARLTSLLKEERPYQLFLVRSSWAQGVCSERPDSPAFPAAVQAGYTVRPGCALAYSWDPERLTGGEEERYWVRGWGALGASRGVEASLTQGLRAADRGNGHAMGPGTRGRWHCQTRGHVCDRAVQTPGEGRLQGQGTPRRRGQRGEGGGSQWSGAPEIRSHRSWGQLLPSGAGI